MTDHPPLIVCIAAPRASGKDTLFTHLRALNPAFRRFAFADQLKHDLVPLIRERFGWDVWDCTAAQKEILRPILISYGCAQRAVNIDHWVARVVEQIRDGWHAAPGFIPCITDLRFASEAVCLHREFGDAVQIVSLTRDGAPEPTDEEKKHSHIVADMAHYYIRWGHDTEAGQRAHARNLLEWLAAERELTLPAAA